MQNRAILITLRAAAIVIIATGLNDVIANAASRYEPLYLYLGAILLVALLDGVIVSLATATLCIGFYGLLFMPRADALSERMLIPAGAGLGVAILGSVIRGVVRSARRRRRPETLFPQTPPLLETSTVAQLAGDNGEVLAAIDELRGELRTVIADLGNVRGREELIADDLRISRARAIEAERQLSVARAEAGMAAARISELELDLRDTERHRNEATIERARADAEKSLRERTERALAEERAARERLQAEAAEFDTRLQTIVTHLASDHEADLGQAMSEKEEARAEARALQVKLAGLQRRYEEERAAATNPPRRPRVLVVHPDAELRSAALVTLERAGYEVVGAADGLEALRLAIASQPEAVIAESSMPKMDGRELCQLLKSQEKTAHIRFILLMRGHDVAPAQGDLTPDEVLRKPVPVETLKSTLASLLAPHTR